MYDYEFFNKFNDDSVHKDWTLTDGTLTLTNSDLFQGSLSLNEILSDSNIIFGSCNAAQLKFTTSNLTSLKGKKLNVSVVIDEETENPLTIGSYTVVEDNLTADRTKREVVAYDDIYFLNQTDVADWYNGLTFPISIKDMRDSFFEEVGITQETVELANDSVMIEKTIFPNQLLAIDVLQKICEINGVCGKINRDDEFHYIELNTSTGVNPYPSLTLYPSTSLYPSLTSVGSGSGESEYQIDVYRSLEYADYTVKKINKLQIREDSDDIGGIVGTGDNCYIIEDNFLMYGKGPEDLQTIGNKILQKIRNIEYTPCTVACNGNPCIEIGDVISIEMNNGNTITTIVLNRTLKGEQALIDTYSNEAEEYQAEKVLSLNTEVIQLKGKSARLKRTVEGLTSTVSEISVDLEENYPTRVEMTSEIQQSATEIQTTVAQTYATQTTTTELQSQITQQSTAINAKVSQTGGQAQSFGWELLSSGFQLKANNNVVFDCDSSGVEITGSFHMTGGSLNITTDSEETSVITLKSGNYTTQMSPSGFLATDGIKSTFIFKDWIRTPEISIGAHTYSSSKNCYVFDNVPVLRHIYGFDALTTASFVYSAEAGGYVLRTLPTISNCWGFSSNNTASNVTLLTGV